MESNGKKEYRKLECVLTDEEVRTKGERIAVLNAMIRTKTEDLKDYNKNEKAEIKLFDKEFDELCRAIGFGKEWREVECLKQRDETNKKIIFIRSDTGEKVSERDMTNKEMQGSLFDSAADKADEALGTPDDSIAAEPVSDEEYEASKAAQIETAEKKKLPTKRKPKLLSEASDDEIAAAEA